MSTARHASWKIGLALAVGTLLWFMPTLLMPVLGGPIGNALRLVGVLGADACAFEARFTAALALRWLAVVLLLGFVLVLERQPLTSLGIRRPKLLDLLLAVGLSIVATVAGFGLYIALGGPQASAKT